MIEHKHSDLVAQLQHKAGPLDRETGRLLHTAAGVIDALAQQADHAVALLHSAGLQTSGESGEPLLVALARMAAERVVARKPERHLKVAVDVETTQAHAALGRLGDLMRETEEAAQRSSAAVERAKAAATTGPIALLDLADKAARVRGGPFPVTPDLDAALRTLQDRIAVRLAEVLT